MAKTELSGAYVTGLLADLEPKVPRLAAELDEARARASRVDAELSALLGRIDEARRALADHERAGEQAATALAAHNARTASLHQETGALTRRAAELKLEMDREGEGPVHARLRRERAKLLVQIEDRQEELKGLEASAGAARGRLTAAEAGAAAEKDRRRQLVLELDRLQTQLPRPHLYLAYAESVAARAHCRFYLDRDPAPWERELRVAIGLVAELHRELRAGKYRLDRYSDVVGGRAAASVEALYAAVATGDTPLARELFATMTDPALRFDHIPNVLRAWCLGLWLEGDGEELGTLLARHRFDQGLAGGYVEAFGGLQARDPRRITAGLRVISKLEWDAWQDPRLTRGAGVVNVAATALARLAVEQGLAVALPGPTVPDEIIAGPRRRLAPAR